MQRRLDDIDVAATVSRLAFDDLRGGTNLDRANNHSAREASHPHPLSNAFPSASRFRLGRSPVHRDTNDTKSAASDIGTIRKGRMVPWLS
jgi:hypothetical protein